MPRFGRAKIGNDLILLVSFPKINIAFTIDETRLEKVIHRKDVNFKIMHGETVPKPQYKNFRRENGVIHRKGR